MEIGIVGLGRMGKNMASRLLENDELNVYVQNRTFSKAKQLEKKGAKAFKTVEDLIQGFSGRKMIWLMLPSGDVTEKNFQKLLNLLDKEDIIIEGANSNFHDTIRRHKEAEDAGIKMLDVGVSGGILAADRGYPLMIGGKETTYNYAKPIFKQLSNKDAYGRVGGPGRGHYVKMIHNAIEYGMMQSIAEGFQLLKNGRFNDVDLQKTATIFNNGCIIDGLLMEMVKNRYDKDVELKELKPFVSDSGEGRWAAKEAIDQGVPFLANTFAVHSRFTSQDENGYAFKLLAAIRNEFGGHAEKKHD